MSEQKNKVQVMEGIMGQLKDLHHSCVALVEKTATLQLKTMEGGLDKLSDRLGKPFSSLSDNAKAIEDIMKDAEGKLNQLKKEAEKEQTK